MTGHAVGNLTIESPEDVQRSILVLEEERRPSLAQRLFGVNGVLVRALYFASPALILVVWEILARAGAVDVRLFSAPSLILKALVPVVASGELWVNTLVSLQRVLLGFLVGSGMGVVLGLAMGLAPPVRAALGPMVAATFPIPKLAIMPLILLVFGLGETSKVVTVAVGVFYLVLINSMAGVMNIDKIYLDVAKSFGASRKDFYLTVALPGALPMIFAGLKLGMGTALLLIVAAELSAARAGVGYMIWRAYDMFDIERMFVGLITMSFMGYILSNLLDVVERVVIPWKH
ncbi:MAG: NitT/TauT family transport system permease protein [Bacillota bacterium]|nr:ABC transporter permease [Bacillota bacterium]MDK2931196.1 NitT/TauT family transport system permease protein [Bacillota bacterium]